MLASNLALLSLALLAYLCLPTAREYTPAFFLVSHYNPATQEYAIGRNDTSLIAFCIIFFTGLRASSIKYVLAPLAKRLGIVKPRDALRLSEQAGLLCYYSVFWTLGLVCYSISPYFDYALTALVHLLHVKILPQLERDVYRLAQLRTS
jgi:acyl-CoA-dependent ceramide synthase